ncbi:MAG: hypothetical protein EXR05_08060 [Acetobacteraceae bacterium]|nr:hypothetical protein [Acetobacteraceae bacterium]
MQEYSQGGFDGILFRAYEWATREQTMCSYELLVRYVMPQFQGSMEKLIGSRERVLNNCKRVVGGAVEAVRRASTDVGREAPEGFKGRTLGGQDG